MSYKFVDQMGFESSTPQAMPEVLKDGMRLSIKERVSTSKLVEGFTFTHGQAEGLATLDRSALSYVYQVEIVGAVLEDVKTVRRMILRELGVRELHPVPEIIYNLRTFWSRIRWILTGEIDPEAFAPIEVPVAH